MESMGIPYTRCHNIRLISVRTHSLLTIVYHQTLQNQNFLAVSKIKPPPDKRTPQCFNYYDWIYYQPLHRVVIHTIVRLQSHGKAGFGAPFDVKTVSLTHGNRHTPYTNLQPQAIYPGGAAGVFDARFLPAAKYPLPPGATRAGEKNAARARLRQDHPRQGMRCLCSGSATRRAAGAFGRQWFRFYRFQPHSFWPGA